MALASTGRLPAPRKEKPLPMIIASVARGWLKKILARLAVGLTYAFKLYTIPASNQRLLAPMREKHLPTPTASVARGWCGNLWKLIAVREWIVLSAIRRDTFVPSRLRLNPARRFAGGKDMPIANAIPMPSVRKG